MDKEEVVFPNVEPQGRLQGQEFVEVICRKLGLNTTARQAKCLTNHRNQEGYQNKATSLGVSVQTQCLKDLREPFPFPVPDNKAKMFAYRRVDDKAFYIDEHHTQTPRHAYPNPQSRSRDRHAAHTSSRWDTRKRSATQRSTSTGARLPEPMCRQPAVLVWRGAVAKGGWGGGGDRNERTETRDCVRGVSIRAQVRAVVTGLGKGIRRGGQVHVGQRNLRPYAGRQKHTQSHSIWHQG